MPSVSGTIASGLTRALDAGCLPGATTSSSAIAACNTDWYMSMDLPLFCSISV